MGLEARLKKIESQVLKSGSYVQSMKIMEQIAEAHHTDNRKDIPNLLIKLWKTSGKPA